MIVRVTESRKLKLAIIPLRSTLKTMSILWCPQRWSYKRRIRSPCHLHNSYRGDTGSFILILMLPAMLRCFRMATLSVNNLTQPRVRTQQKIKCVSKKWTSIKIVLIRKTPIWCQLPKQLQLLKLLGKRLQSSWLQPLQALRDRKTGTIWTVTKNTLTSQKAL